jgi:hypothetical protein
MADCGFTKARGPDTPSIPLFYPSTIPIPSVPGGTRGKCAKRTPKAVAGSRWPAVKTNPIWWGQMCKTKPIGRSFKFEVSSVKQEKHSCRTKPILEECQVWSAKCEVQNVPNSARPGHGQVPSGQKRRNKPNFWRAGRLGPVNCAKRTQFPAGPGGTGPQGRGTRGNCAKRTQFPAGPGGTGPQGRGTRGNCAKRTQFPAGPGGTRPQGRGTRGNRAKRTQSPSLRPVRGGWNPPRDAGGAPAGSFS